MSLTKVSDNKYKNAFDLITDKDSVFDFFRACSSPSRKQKVDAIARTPYDLFWENFILADILLHV